MQSTFKIGRSGWVREHHKWLPVWKDSTVLLICAYYGGDFEFNVVLKTMSRVLVPLEMVLFSLFLWGFYFMVGFLSF